MTITTDQDQSISVTLSAADSKLVLPAYDADVTVTGSGKVVVDGTEYKVADYATIPDVEAVNAAAVSLGTVFGLTDMAPSTDAAQPTQYTTAEVGDSSSVISWTSDAVTLNGVVMTVAREGSDDTEITAVQINGSDKVELTWSTGSNGDLNGKKAVAKVTLTSNTIAKDYYIEITLTDAA